MQRQAGMYRFQSKALWGARLQINEGKDTEFSFFFFFLTYSTQKKSLGLQYVTLHFNAFPPPDGLDKNLLVSFVQMVSYKKSLFLTFLPQGLNLTFFFFRSEVFTGV